MQVSVRLHGVLVRQAGAESIDVECEATDSVQNVLDKLADLAPSLTQELERTACAIGDRLVSRDTPIESETELALIPPVSGG